MLESERNEGKCWKWNEIEMKKNVESNNVKRNIEMKRTWKEKWNEIKVEIKKKLLQGKRNEREEMKRNGGTRKEMLKMK